MEYGFLVLFSVLVVLGALGTVLGRHPIGAALSLVMSMLALASIYALLEAHLLAAIQVIVYVGAIMVLIIYTILLMDIRDEDLRGKVTFPRLLGGALGLVWLGAVWNRVAARDVDTVAPVPEGFGTVKGIAHELYTDHLLTFELVSMLLLAGIVDALVLAVRGGKDGSSLKEGP